VPIFHFHIKDGYSQPDHDGTDLPDLARARMESVRLAGAVLHDQPADLWHGTPWLLTVTDGADKPLFRLSFSAEMLEAA
jgi:hypothetical protein